MAELKIAGSSPTREGLVAALQSATLEINGAPEVCDKVSHQGMSFADLLLVTRDSKFKH